MFNKNITIQNNKIGDDYFPYIIAEMSANHANDLDFAKQTIIKAKQSGADAIKIQTYKADTLTLNCKKKEFLAKGAWSGQYLYDLYKKAAMPWHWLDELLATAKNHDITLFSSPFDKSSVEFLEKYNLPAYKIASPEIVDLPLIEFVASTKKTIIISTGCATLAQIDLACETILKTGNQNLAILKCTSDYPAKAADLNLNSIEFLKQHYKCPVGFSDHTKGSYAPITACALGANIIEKHFILDKTKTTADSFFSATPDILKTISKDTKNAFLAKGEVNFPIKIAKNQRSLIAIKDIKKGEKLKVDFNFKSLRPGGGISPKYANFIDQKSVKKDISFGSLLDFSMLFDL